MCGVGHCNDAASLGVNRPKHATNISYLMRVKPIDTKNERPEAIVRPLDETDAVAGSKFPEGPPRLLFDLARNHAFRTGSPCAVRYLW